MVERPQDYVEAGQRRVLRQRQMLTLSRRPGRAHRMVERLLAGGGGQQAQDCCGGAQP